MDSGSVLIDFGQLDTNLSGRGNFTEKLSSSDWPVGEPNGGVDSRSIWENFAHCGWRHPWAADPGF